MFKVYKKKVIQVTQLPNFCEKAGELAFLYVLVFSLHRFSLFKTHHECEIEHDEGKNEHIPVISQALYVPLQHYKRSSR